MGRNERVRCRQRIISTAVVYLARFFYNNSFRDFHPHLIAATALLLAAKVCELFGFVSVLADSARAGRGMSLSSEQYCPDPPPFSPTTLPLTLAPFLLHSTKLATPTAAAKAGCQPLL